MASIAVVSGLLAGLALHRALANDPAIASANLSAIAQEAAAAGSATTDWRVRAPAPTSGSAWQVTSTLDHQLAVTFKVRGTELRKFEQALHEHSRATVELIADPDRELTAQVRYDEFESTLRRNAVDEQSTLDADHREFAVSMRDGEPLVSQRDAKSGASNLLKTGDLADQVARLSREALAGGWLATLLANGPVVSQTAIEVPLATGTPLLDEALHGATLQRFVLTPIALREESGVECLVLLATATAEQPPLPKSRPPEVTTTFELSGEIAVRREDGRIVAMTLAGPLRCAGSTDSGSSQVEIAGTGTLTWTYRASPLPR